MPTFTLQQIKDLYKQDNNVRSLFQKWGKEKDSGRRLYAIAEEVKSHFPMTTINDYSALASKLLTLFGLNDNRIRSSRRKNNHRIVTNQAIPMADQTSNTQNKYQEIIQAVKYAGGGKIEIDDIKITL